MRTGLILLLCICLGGCATAGNAPIEFGTLKMRVTTDASGKQKFGRPKKITAGTATEKEQKELQRIAERYQDHGKLAEYVYHNFKYVTDTDPQNETWQEWWETLKTGRGDCEDFQHFAQAVLRLQGLRSECVLVAFDNAKTDAHGNRIRECHILDVWLEKCEGGYRGYSLDNEAGYLQGAVAQTPETAFDGLLENFARVYRERSRWNPTVINLRQAALVYTMDYSSGYFIQTDLNNMVN